MIRKWMAGLALALLAPLTWAVSPYYYGDKLAASSPQAHAATIEDKLKAAGFRPIGRYFPKGLPEYGVVIATHPALQAAAAAVGRHAILSAVVRVGVKADGTVSYSNPGYWGRAYLRRDFNRYQADYLRVETALQSALGAGKVFGGDESPRTLEAYRYMIGMEKLDSPKSLLTRAANFNAAVKTVREQLARGTGSTARVYEVVLPDSKLAVFGVALNDAALGDAAWLSKIGMTESIAGLPYEVYVIDNEIHSPFARFRIALAFPDVGMGQFMRISALPNAILATMKSVAGVEPPAPEKSAWEN